MKNGERLSGKKAFYDKDNWTHREEGISQNDLENSSWKSVIILI